MLTFNIAYYYYYYHQDANRANVPQKNVFADLRKKKRKYPRSSAMVCLVKSLL